MECHCQKSNVGLANMTATFEWHCLLKLHHCVVPWPTWKFCGPWWFQPMSFPSRVQKTSNSISKSVRTKWKRHPAEILNQIQRIRLDNICEADFESVDFKLGFSTIVTPGALISPERIFNIFCVITCRTKSGSESFFSDQVWAHAVERLFQQSLPREAFLYLLYILYGELNEILPRAREVS